MKANEIIWNIEFRQETRLSFNSQSRLFIIPHCISVNGNVEGHSNIATGKFNCWNVWEDWMPFGCHYQVSKSIRRECKLPLQVLRFVGKLHDLPCRPWKASTTYSESLPKALFHGAFVPRHSDAFCWAFELISLEPTVSIESACFIII